MTKMSTMKLSFFHVILFNFTAIFPHPSAWFPLNYTYETKEIENRTTSGIKEHEVYLSQGPDGTQNGSYLFRGPQTNSITFPDSKLDIGLPITIVCWLYTYDNNAKTEVFLQYKGIHLSANHKELKLSSSSNDQLLTGTLAEKGWTFVGVSYSKMTAEVKLWIHGNVVNSTTLIALFDSSGPQLPKLGGNNFKGKMTQLMLFNLTLTQAQMQRIKGRMKLPGETESHTYKIKTIIFRYFEIVYYFELKMSAYHAPTFLSLYIITQVILALRLVLANDLLEDRRIDDDSARFQFFFKAAQFFEPITILCYA